MQLSIVNKVVIILNYIVNLLYYIRLTILCCVVKLQLNKFLFTIERDRNNIFFAFFNTKIFSILLLR
jgi:hypothetical protein